MTTAVSVAYVLEGTGLHALTFRVVDLPAGKVACMKCGQYLTREDWARGDRCPGRRGAA